MNKGQLLRVLQPFTDDIDIYVLDSQNKPTLIKSIDYVGIDGIACLELVPIGTYQQNPKALQLNILGSLNE